jgi:uncharacterized membrane protein YfcA
MDAAAPPMQQRLRLDGRHLIFHIAACGRRAVPRAARRASRRAPGRRRRVARLLIVPGFESLTLPVLVWIAVVMAISGLMQGALGLGFPTVATPLIALVADMRTAIILVLLPCLATVALNVVRGGPLKGVLARFWMMPVYSIAGAAAGTQIFVAYPRFPYALLLAAVIVIYLNLDRIGRTQWRVVQRRPQPFGLLAGLAAGLSEGTANVAAPPLIVYYLALGVTPTVLVQAMNLSFLAGKATQFATLATVGGVPALQWVMTLPLAAIAIAGAMAGIRIRDRIDAATFRRWLKGALLAMAVLLVVQQALR